MPDDDFKKINYNTIPVFWLYVSTVAEFVGIGQRSGAGMPTRLRWRVLTAWPRRNNEFSIFDSMAVDSTPTA